MVQPAGRPVAGKGGGIFLESGARFNGATGGVGIFGKVEGVFGGMPAGTLPNGGMPAGGIPSGTSPGAGIGFISGGVNCSAIDFASAAAISS